MKAILFILAILLFCMSDSLVAMLLGVAAFFTLIIFTDSDKKQFDDKPL